MTEIGPHETAGARPSTIPALDSVRFIGVLAVILTHVGFHAGVYTSTGTFGHLMSRMAVGVSVFFVLSGFLLSREWLVRAVRSEPAPSAGRYYWKRWWRIMPAYLCVAVVCLLAFSANHDRGVGGWLRTLAMADSYTTHALPDGFTQTWSLTTEVAFYLVLPLLMLALVGRRVRPVRIVAGLLVLVALTLVWLATMDSISAFDGRPVGNWLPAYLSWFAAGIGLAAVHTAPASFPRTHRALTALASSAGSCWVLAAAALLVASTPLAGPWLLLPLTPGEEIVRHVLYLAVGVLVIVPAAFGSPESRYVRFLAAPLPRHLGHISYSMFLVHMALIQAVMKVFGLQQFGGHFVLILVLTLVSSIAVSEVLYRFVERPFVRLSRGRPSPASTTPSAANAAS
jgi:peptidoglycan/LPS O-acetylase OafA/YrhL